MMIAKEYGQAPAAVAAWEPEWLAAAATVISAQHGAEAEIAKRTERRRRQKRGA